MGIRKNIYRALIHVDEKTAMHPGVIEAWVRALSEAPEIYIILSFIVRRLASLTEKANVTKAIVGLLELLSEEDLKAAMARAEDRRDRDAFSCEIQTNAAEIFGCLGRHGVMQKEVVTALLMKHLQKLINQRQVDGSRYS